MKFELVKASDSSFREVVEVITIEDLKEVTVIIGKDARSDKYDPLVVDFGIGSDAWGHSGYYDQPLEEGLSGVIVVYDDYL